MWNLLSKPDSRAPTAEVYIFFSRAHWRMFRCTVGVTTSVAVCLFASQPPSVSICLYLPVFLHLSLRQCPSLSSCLFVSHTPSHYLSLFASLSASVTICLSLFASESPSLSFSLCTLYISINSSLSVCVSDLSFSPPLLSQRIPLSYIRNT